MSLSFTGCVFDDINADGIVLQRDADGNLTNQEEAGFSGVTIRVVDGDGNIVAFENENGQTVTSTVTNDQGFYFIYGLGNSDYKIQFDYQGDSDLAGRSLSPANVFEPSLGVAGSDFKDSDGVTELSAGLVETDFITAGTPEATKVNLGLTPGSSDPGTGKIGNRVFLDENGNGILDNGESGVNGVRVTLSGAGADGEFGTGDDINRVQTINNDGGFYGFDNLDAGQYKVIFDNLPDGATFTTADVGSDEHLDSDVDVNTGMTEVIDLAAGEQLNNIDAGIVAGSGPVDPGTGKIGNRVFLDENGNGILDNGESGVNGVRVTLAGAGADGEFGTGDDITRVQTINNDGGFYGFENLDAGQYKVTFDNLPEGASFTTQDVGNDEHLDSDVDVNTGMTDVIDLAAGEQLNNVDAGIVEGSGPVDPGTGKIGNRVFLDENGNGIFDNGESGVNGVRVTLAGAGADGEFGTGDDISRVQTINNDGGFYGFEGLDAGQYKVRFDNLPDGATFTTANVGDDEHLDSDVDVNTGMTEVIDLAAGQQLNNIDAGIVEGSGPVDPGTGKIGNRVFLDENGNGILDNGESGVNGVRVTLAGAGADGEFGTGDDISRVQTINNDGGFYGFENLDAGQYKVTFDNLPDGATFTTQDVGNDEHLDSDVDVNTGMTEVIDLAAGQQLNNVDAGVIAAPANDDPNAADDGSSTLVGTPVTIDVLGNDADPNGDVLSVSSLEGQTVVPGETVFTPNGAVTLLDNGQLSFTPNAGFVGNETFSYHVSDGNGGEDTANVRVTVSPEPDPGTGKIGNRVFLDENGNGILDNGESGVNGVRATLSGAGADGQFGTGDDITRVQTINNDGGFYGFEDLDAGQYKVTFDSLPDGATFTTANVGGNEGLDSDVDPSNGMTDVINLAAGQQLNNVDAGILPAVPSNSDPNATDDSSSTQVGTPVTISLLGNDSDSDGDALSVTSLNGQAVSVGDTITTNNGSATLLANGEVSFNPNAGFIGNETFSYHVSDGNGGEDTANVLVNVTPLPNSNPDAVNDSRTTEVNTPLTIDVLGNDTDPDGDTLSIKEIVGNAVNGNAQIVDGQIVYTPNDGFVGNDTFAYQISDGNGGHDVAQVTVTIDPAPNSAPDATDDSSSTDFGTPVTINVLGNDADPDGDALSITSLNGESVAPGQPVFTDNGVVTLLDDGQLSFVPNDGFVGEETFSYHVNDGNGGEDTANVVVTVAPEPNVAPNAANDSAITDEGTPVTIDVLGNDADPDGDALSVTSLNGQSISVGETIATDNGSVTLLDNGQLSFTPDDGFTGTETFSYHVNDGNGGEDTADVSVVVDAIQRGSIEGTAFHDDNGNGIQDSGSGFGPNLIVNGNFENNSLNNSGVDFHVTGSELPGWTVASHDVSIYESNSSDFNNAHGDAVVELEGGSVLRQNVNVTDAGTYVLTFNVLENLNEHPNDNDFEVKINGQTVRSVVASGQSTVSVEVDLQAGQQSLEFVSGSGDLGDGAGIDDVSLKQKFTSEPGKSGLTVELFNGNGDFVDSTTTNSNGDYQFDNLLPDDYQLSFEQPDRTEFTTQDVGNNDAIDSDVDSFGLTGFVSLAEGQHLPNVDAGLISTNNAPVHTGQGDYFSVGDAYRGGGNDNPGRELVVDLSQIVSDPDGDDLTFSLNFANQRREQGDDNAAGFMGWDVKSFNADTGRLVLQVYTEYRETWRFDRLPGSDLGEFSFTATDSFGASKEGEFRVDVWDQGFQTPLALDLNGDGVQTLSIDQGVTFDMLNSGTAINTGWLSGQDGFLAIDNNGDGLISSRAELFGGEGPAAGFDKLSGFDSNGDGWVNAADAGFGELSLWQDANENGFTDVGELRSLADAGIEALNVNYTSEFNLDAQGNILGERSVAQTTAGNNIDLVDVYFQVAEPMTNQGSAL